MTECWFSTGSRAHVRLGGCKQGRVVRKRVNANLGLKVNRSIDFSSIQMLSTAFVLCIIRLFNSKQKAKQHTENLTATLQTEIKILAYPGLA